jgi:hypothetical protein
MPVTILCPNLRCRTILTVPETVRGKKVRCSQCGIAFLVPAGGAASPKPDKKGKAEAAPAASGKSK